MKQTALFTLLAIFALAACEKKPSEPFVPDPIVPSSSALPPGHPPINSGDAAMNDAPDVEQTQQATVVSVIDIPQFTYIEIRQDNQTRWLATSTTAVKKGNTIQFDSGSTMDNFTSKALHRTFPSMTFVNRVSIVKGK